VRVGGPHSYLADPSSRRRTLTVVHVERCLFDQSTAAKSLPAGWCVGLRRIGGRSIEVHQPCSCGRHPGVQRRIDCVLIVSIGSVVQVHVSRASL
jgi:hypothetical protein